MIINSTGLFDRPFSLSAIINETVNRIWYAGAYTNQLDTIDPLRGDALIFFQKITSTTIVNGTLPW